MKMKIKLSEIRDEMGKLKNSRTVEKEYKNGDIIKLSQTLHRIFKCGHYFFYIENKDGIIIYAGASTASPPSKITPKELSRLYKNYQDCIK